MKIRRSSERGVTNIGWLESYHTFSFGQYHDRNWMGFGPLRVINDDTVGPGGGFDPHPHQDMEIISYVTSGALAHRDSMGHESVVPAGRLQRMSAGRGVVHSEYNASKTEPVHFFQIWIQPDTRGIAPEYEELDVAAAPEISGWRLLASPDAGDGAMTIHQDVRLWEGTLATDGRKEFNLQHGRKLWAHVAKGVVRIDDESLSAGDAAIIETAGAHHVEASEEGHLLLFEV